MLSVSFESFSSLCFPRVELKTRPLFILTYSSEQNNSFFPSLDLLMKLKCSVTRSIGTSVNSREARVGPVSSGYGGVVLLLTGLVEHWQQLSGFHSGGLQIDHSVCPVSIIGVEDEVTMEISGVEAGQRQPVTISREGSLGRSHGGSGGRGVEIMEEMIGDVSRDASALQCQHYIQHTFLLCLLYLV